MQPQKQSTTVNISILQQYLDPKLECILYRLANGEWGGRGDGHFRRLDVEDTRLEGRMN